jgi:hypothetical protein
MNWVRTDWRLHWGDRYQFLPHLGLFFFPFGFINLQGHKPASVDLLTSQFTGELREIHPDFLSRSLVTGARVFHPTDAHLARMRLHNVLPLCTCTLVLNTFSAQAPYVPLSTLKAAHLN